MRSHPDPESLRLLVLVAERGSLSAAAEQAGVSQPAASKRLGSLERRLGVTLVDRRRSGSVLTPDGEIVVGWAQRVLDELDDLADGVEALRTRASAQLSVAASLTVAEHLLPARLRELRGTDPDLRVGLQVMNSRRVCELARERAVDLGFIESPGGVVGLRTRIVARDRLVLVVGPSHRWARRRRPVDVGELAGTALISREPGSGTRETVERAVAAHDRRLAQPLLELGSSAAIRSAVLADDGAALLSDLVVAPDVASGLLCEVPTTGIDLTRDLRAVWPTGATPTGPAATLVTLLRRRHGAPAARAPRPGNLDP